MECVCVWLGRGSSRGGELLLYALFNHSRRQSRFSGSRKLSYRIVLTVLSHKLSGVNVVG